MSSSSSPSFPSSPSPPDDASIWETLNTLEAKLLASLHQSTNTLLPQIVDTSQEILDQLHSLSADAYHKSLNLATTHLDFLLPQPSNSPGSTTAPSSLPLQQHPLDPSGLLHTLHPPPSDHPSNWFFRLFRPRHLIILTGIFFSSRFTLGLLINSSYFDRWTRSNPSLAQKIPRCLLSSNSRKIIKKRARRSSAGTPARLEVIVVLGADPGSAGSQIALHLTQIGYVVIASVSRAEYVGSLEMDGLGWLKALVLDPLIPNQTRAFNRSLAACLNKFPLNATHAPDPSSNQTGRQSSLVGLINCLPISFPDVLRPVESIDLDDHLISPIQSIAGLSLEVIKVVLPMIRNSIDKFGVNDGVILTLFPTKTTSVALPYLSSSIIANQTLETLMQTLRREIKISNSDSKRSIRIINEKIGSFRPSHHFTGASIHHSTVTHQGLPSLPIHLHPIYAPSLSRRIGILNLPTTGLAILSPSGNPISQLIKRVQEIIQSPSIRSGSSISTGREVWKFNTIQHFLPNVLVESWLQLTENLNGWVRKKVISEIDLESNENLEKMIEKRKFSSRSDWKNGIFFHDSSVPDPPQEHHEEPQEHEEEKVVVVNEKEGEEGDVTLQTNQPEELPNPPEFISVATDCSDAETGSVIDKGEQPSPSPSSSVLDATSPPVDPLNHSFVGSEIDWKENSNDVKSSSS